MKHQSAAVQFVCDIGFYNINPATFSLVSPISDLLDRSSLAQWCLCGEAERHFISNEIEAV